MYQNENDLGRKLTFKQQRSENFMITCSIFTLIDSEKPMNPLNGHRLMMIKKCQTKKFIYWINKNLLNDEWMKLLHLTEKMYKLLKIFSPNHSIKKNLKLAIAKHYFLFKLKVLLITTHRKKIIQISFRLNATHNSSVKNQLRFRWKHLDLYQ